MYSLSDRFAALGPREQRWLWVGFLTMLLVFLGVTVLTAVRSLSASQKAHQQADAQLQTLLRLQVRAKALQAQPKLNQIEVVNRLQSSVSLLGGKTEISIGDQRVNLVLRSTPARALAEWLARVRTDAHVVPIEARLVRETKTDDALWSGTLVMMLSPLDAK